MASSCSLNAQFNPFLMGCAARRRAAGRLGRRFEMVRCEYAAPAFVIAGLDTEKSGHPAWSSPAVTGAGLRSRANKAAMQMTKAHTSCKARLHLLPVLVLFRPVIAGEPNHPDGRRGAPVSCFPPAPYEEITGRRVVSGVLFFSCYLQANRRGLHWTVPLA